MRSRNFKIILHHFYKVNKLNIFSDLKLLFLFAPFMMNCKYCFFSEQVYYPGRMSLNKPTDPTITRSLHFLRLVIRSRSNLALYG